VLSPAARPGASCCSLAANPAVDRDVRISWSAPPRADLNALSANSAPPNTAPNPGPAGLTGSPADALFAPHAHPAAGHNTPRMQARMQASRGQAGARASRRSAVRVHAVAAVPKAAVSSSKVALLTPEAAKAMYYDMVLGREFEEMCAQMYYRGKMFGFVHLYSGQEAVSTGVIGAMRPDDYVCSTYRDHVHALSKGVAAREVGTPHILNPGAPSGQGRGEGDAMGAGQGAPGKARHGRTPHVCKLAGAGEAAAGPYEARDA
jgi:hypothetical protein